MHLEVLIETATYLLKDLQIDGVQRMTWVSSMYFCFLNYWIIDVYDYRSLLRAPLHAGHRFSFINIC
jgi:hypothetical protein